MVRPCTGRGSARSPLHTSASGFASLAAQRNAAHPLGRMPPRSHTFGLPVVDADFCVRPQLLSQHVASWLRSDRLARQREIVQKCEEFLVGKETLPQTEQHGHRCIPLVATLFMWTTDGQMENFKTIGPPSRATRSAWRLWRSSRKPPLRRRTRSSWLHHDRSYQRARGLHTCNLPASGRRTRQEKWQRHTAWRLVERWFSTPTCSQCRPTPPGLRRYFIRPSRRASMISGGTAPRARNNLS